MSLQLRLHSQPQGEFHCMCAVFFSGIDMLAKAVDVEVTLILLQACWISWMGPWNMSQRRRVLAARFCTCSWLNSTQPLAAGSGRCGLSVPHMSNETCPIGVAPTKSCVVILQGLVQLLTANKPTSLPMDIMPAPACSSCFHISSWLLIYCRRSPRRTG